MSFSKIIFLLLFLLVQEKAITQTFGIQFRTGSSIEIPFEYHNNLIVIDLVLGKKLPVKFIFDTGAEHTIICKKEIASLLNLPFEREFIIVGADFRKELKAYLVKKVDLSLVNSLGHAEQDMLVLDEDYYRLDECTGEPIHGIIGADMFNRYVVKIDYVRKKIKLTDPGKFTAPKKFYRFRLDINKGKPYFYPDLALRPNEFFRVKLLLDTGAGLSLLLFNNTHPSLRPPENSVRGTLAMGLGGSVEGFVGKINTLKLNDTIAFPNMICDFQDIELLLDSSFTATRNGIMGEKLLSRFDVVIDYVRGDLYLKPNKWAKKPLEEDKSGLMIMAQGRKLDDYYVNDVIPGSPANWADIREGDVIIKINRVPTPFYSIDDISRIFRGKAGKNITITILRNGRKYKKHFMLKSLF